MTEKQSTSAVERKEHEEAMEQAAILAKANETKGMTLDFNIDGDIEVSNELNQVLLEQIDDPKEKYNVYYKVVQNILIRHLPKGDDNKKFRDMIYEEKNVFLTRGNRKKPDGTRGADGRQGYLSDMMELVPVISKWIDAGANMFELYCLLRDMNKAKGYPME